MPKPTYEQPAEEIRALKDKIVKLKQANEKLKDSEKIYRALFETAGFSIALINPNTERFVIFNKTEHESLGYTKGEFEKLPIDAPVVLEDDERKKNIETVNENGSHYFESRHRTKNGEIQNRFISSTRVFINGEIYHLNIASDITPLKNAEKALKEARDELEKRVERRTAELKRKTIELTKSNIAFKVLLQKQDEALKDVEERLLGNTKQLILPHLENLKNTRLTERQLISLIELELNLKNILSPFLTRLSSQFHNLTPTEIKIASLIREGRTSKEIANLLTVSMKTIEVHRDNLREKLGIKHKKINLQSYLQAMKTP